jgi:hypothetical protein
MTYFTVAFCCGYVQKTQTFFRIMTYSRLKRNVKNDENKHSKICKSLKGQ